MGTSALDSAGLGLFEYEHADRFESPWRFADVLLLAQQRGRVSGPYFRNAVPSRPLHVDQLPPWLRRFFSTVRFKGLSFADDRAIQPAEHAACASDQGEYLTLAGERVTFPEGAPGRPS